MTPGQGVQSGAEGQKVAAQSLKGGHSLGPVGQLVAMGHRQDELTTSSSSKDADTKYLDAWDSKKF